MIKKFSTYVSLVVLVFANITTINISQAHAASKNKKVNTVKAKLPRKAKPFVKNSVVRDTSTTITTTSTSTTSSTLNTEKKEAVNSKDKQNDSLKGMFSGSSETKSPLFIKSDTLELNAKEKVFLYKGNVELIRDDMKVTAKKLEGKYDDQNRIETVLCLGDVVITKGPSIKATSNRALYKVAAAVVELTEGPELLRDGNILVADKVTIFINEDRSEAEGNVRVKVIKTNDQGITPKGNQ